MKITHPVWAVLITCVAMFTQILVGAGPAMLLLDSDDALYRPLGMIGITLASLGLVYVIRRFGRQTWQGVGLTMSWRAVPHLLLGIVAGGAAVAAAGALAVTVGVATWVPSEVARPDLSLLPLSIAFALLSQAFPEELLWRGHLYDTLSARMSPRAVLIVVSVVFGVLHIFSQSAADTPVERLIYPLQAIALGFACAAARWRTGAVWMAVGVHTGLHTGNILFPAQSVNFGVHVVILTCTLTVTGLLIMARRRPTTTGAERGQTLPSPSHGG
ncbi:MULTISPECIES: CPBP family intramembrane glutamic endopeptidase [unclassified Nonomuraea]|uniref:CPBP family intramembrane glutamic endopeptidase n=1 Tax=unclassified Nonomuraea TaxID=2593643 RepID=UPI001376F96B|nr:MULTISPECIES: type II CAAX endopeptidase family protein [unclassified Nonomuraea]NBF00073.1 CPBP family intramembrane metalloprotease [Nonomuraea sp. K271]